MKVKEPHFHNDDFRMTAYSWRVDKTRGGFRYCPWNGSMHPEDLLKVLKEGARLDMADWKYGWPHKYYVEGVPDPEAGKIVKIGSSLKRVGDVITDEPIMGPKSKTLFLKFYTVHLNDVVEGIEELLDLINKAQGVLHWGWDKEGGVKYQQKSAWFPPLPEGAEPK